MKSKHRHDLETNALAKRVAVVIDALRPYSSTIFGIVLAIAVVLMVVSYFSGASSARQSEAWDVFNQAVDGPVPDLDLLRKSAEENAGTPMQEWADATWADGQVWAASVQYMQNRTAATDSLNRAMSAYQSLLKDTKDERLIGRAHFGLGRVYELRNELDKARQEYLAVSGGFAALARQRVLDLDKKNSKETYDWLATAEMPRRTAPSGPGTPGTRPRFSEDDLEMPSAGEATPEAGETPSATAVEDLFKGIGQSEGNDTEGDRYGTDGSASPTDDSAANAGGTSAAPAKKAAEKPAKGK